MAAPQYQSGFGNAFESEAVAGALPKGQNSPQQPPLGLYAEQLSGSAFTAPQSHQLRTWLYRIFPSVKQKAFTRYKHDSFLSESRPPASPSQMRWNPLTFPAGKVDMVDALHTIVCGGDVNSWTGLSVHVYAATDNMTGRYFYSADGEMLFVPQEGGLTLRTEMGLLKVAVGEIAVIPRGVRFAVDLDDGKARGYVCENHGAPFTLPDLGPIGSNGLAHPRHFLYPVAAYEDKAGDFKLIAKFDGALWQASIDHSPLDVVAWHGNCVPYKYDLAKFMVVNTVSFDHADPSIFTVLTSPSGTAGVANVDFVIFPPRWSVAENTFRPPYFHRNIMNEFMGLIHGTYDAKEKGGFLPGGYSLHNCMSAHGPDSTVLDKAMNSDLKPEKIENTLAFMFESRHVMRVTDYALKNNLQSDYHDCWQDMPKMFKA